MTTMTRIAAMAIARLQPETIAIFNDKLKSGKRSLKVWGWTEKDYESCANLLRTMGCKVEFKKYFYTSCTMMNGEMVQRRKLRTRLHVKEW